MMKINKLHKTNNENQWEQTCRQRGLPQSLAKVMLLRMKTLQHISHL